MEKKGTKRHIIKDTRNKNEIFINNLGQYEIR